jgi:ketosteroid isomerase-like protein
MNRMMDNKLTYPIAAYFQAVNARNSNLLADHFSEDAVVEDEGHEYHGIAAIKEWNEVTCKKYDLKLEVISVTHKYGKTIVTAEASGVFEGSPALIDCCFTEANNRVTSLRCG